MTENETQEKTIITETLPSGVKAIIIGDPSPESCRNFLRLLLKLHQKERARNENT